jgi:hypothetical protein
MVPLLLLYTSFEFDQKVNREAMGGLGGFKNRWRFFWRTVGFESVLGRLGFF